MTGTPVAVDVLLADGSIAQVRAFTRTDREQLLDLHDRASEDSRYLRFFTSGQQPARRYIEHLCAPGTAALAVVALRDDRVIGLATAEQIGAEVAEVSFFVADDAAGLGVATLLLEQLVVIARDHGLWRFIAEVKAANQAMLRVLRDAGFDLTEKVDGDVVHVEMSTEAVRCAVEAADARESRAEASSLRALREPRSIAVAGVRSDGTGVGRAILTSIREAGFAGMLTVIHPRLHEVDDIPAVPSVSAVCHLVDLLIVAVPVGQVLDLIEDAGGAGVGCAVIVTSGFAEADSAGVDLQHAVVSAARRPGMRLIGPNCFGVARPGVALEATFARSASVPGKVAIASQSGGVGIALQDAARRNGLGLAAFVSLGNKADVSGNDLLAAWSVDDDVEVAALYLESFGNPRKFARLARRFSERKPLLAIVGGSSAAGSRAGASHTAAACSSSTTVRALFAQSGVIPVEDLDDLVETAGVMVTGRSPRGPRLGVLGNAGGLGVLAADAAAAEHLIVPAASSALRQRISDELGALPGASNPIDLGAGATPDRFATAIRSVGNSGEFDSLLVVFAATRLASTTHVVRGIEEAVAGLAIPVVLVVHGDSPAPERPTPGLARAASVQGAVRALAHAVAYRVWRTTPRPDVDMGDRASSTAARERARRLVDGCDARGRWLAQDEIADLLGRYGIKAGVGSLAGDREDTIAAARQVGYPVVLKVADPAVLHKTERGLVRIGLVDEDAVGRAYDEFTDVLAAPRVPVLVQPVVEPGVEIAVGVVRDGQFGPQVMVAAGGIHTDVWADRTFLTPPVTPLDAARALRKLRIARILEGDRGSPGADLDAVVAVVYAVARLAEDIPEVAELDLNPVIAGPDGVTCVDARLRLAVVTERPNALERALSPA